MKNIYDLTYNQLENLMLSINEKKFKANQIYKWLYKKRVKDFSEMTDIKKSVIDFLNINYYIPDFKVVDKQVSSDGTIKFLFELYDSKLIETVLMKFDYGNSICVTTQVGCNMGCKFCASGLLKKQRDLTSGEIVAQLMKCLEHIDGQRIDNIVVMGIGEPFDNYDNVLNFCHIINNNFGLAIGARHITISTCGIAPMIKKFAAEKTQYNLAISLHAPNDEIRNQLMPINKAYNLDNLFDALEYYCSICNRKITFEYIMLDGINDTDKCALELSKLSKRIHCYINLIGYNSVDEHGFLGSNHKRILKFYDILKKNKVNVTIRNKVGDDIDAACGQLRAKKEGII